MKSFCTAVLHKGGSMKLIDKIKMLIYKMMNKEVWSEAENFVFYVCGREALPEPLSSEEGVQPLSEVVLSRRQKSGAVFYQTIATHLVVLLVEHLYNLLCIERLLREGVHDMGIL